MSTEVNSPKIVFELWPHYADCFRCGKETRSSRAWPYYEEFLPPDDPNPGRGYVSVCGDCYCLMEDHFERLAKTANQPEETEMSDWLKGFGDKWVWCLDCDGCGWCEGTPSWTCTKCNGTGRINARPPEERG